MMEVLEEIITGSISMLDKPRCYASPENVVEEAGDGNMVEGMNFSGKGIHHISTCPLCLLRSNSSNIAYLGPRRLTGIR